MHVRNGFTHVNNPSAAFRSEALQSFRDWILAADFPCVGAKAALNADSYALAVYDELASPAAISALAQQLRSFNDSLAAENEYATCIAVFRNPAELDEIAFEQLLWQQLQQLHALDDAPWDASVRADPEDPHFSFSFAGQAFYVIGLHANSSRRARRFPWPTLVFNPHEQFERLRADGKWKKIQQTIRKRDVQLQGNTNPMLSDFGERSEARQYSGRVVDDHWEPPIGKCPFHHGQ